MDKKENYSTPSKPLLSIRLNNSQGPQRVIVTDNELDRRYSSKLTERSKETSNFINHSTYIKSLNERKEKSADRISRKRMLPEMVLHEEEKPIKMHINTNLDKVVNLPTKIDIAQQETNIPLSIHKKFEILHINGKSYTKLNLVGRGGSSQVYKVLNENNDVFALKCVDLRNLPQNQLEDYINEVKLLHKLQGKPGIISLIDYELNTDDKLLNILMEYGETDLRYFLQDYQNKNTSIDMNLIRLLWQQMLQSVNTIHQANIIHTDLKPANFIFVRGCLKLIDFGIASTINPESTSVLRDAKKGTLNYMAPESIIAENDSNGVKGIRLRQSCDIWSLGCILYQMVYGKSPFQNLSLERKVAAIVSDSFAISFPKLDNPWLMDVMKSCLQRKPEKRPSINGVGGLLQHPFLQPQGDRAMQLFRAAALGNENMQGVVKQILDNADDELWNTPDFVDRVCIELAKQCEKTIRVSFTDALQSIKQNPLFIC